jgi:hypothetical protein
MSVIFCFFKCAVQRLQHRSPPATGHTHLIFCCPAANASVQFNLLWSRYQCHRSRVCFSRHLRRRGFPAVAHCISFIFFSISIIFFLLSLARGASVTIRVIGEDRQPSQLSMFSTRKRGPVCVCVCGRVCVCARARDELYGFSTVSGCRM